jgi:hemerythrin
MALITWNNSYSVNIQNIDNQHKKLVELVNLLHASMKEGKGKDVLDQIFVELANYTVFHFGFEEKLFAQYGYPDAGTHKRQHNDLKEQVNELQKKQKEGNVLTIEVMNFLKQWLTEHIQGSDKKYTTFLNSKGII